MTIEKAVERLRQEYAAAWKDRWILDPVAYALRKIAKEADTDCQTAPMARGDMPAKGKASPLPFEEEKRASGSGWMEAWFEAELIEGEPECKALVECAFTHGHCVDVDGCTWEINEHADYNVRYGFRLWAGDEPPTEDEREAADWNGN